MTDLLQKFTKNAEELDSLMIEMLEENKQLKKYHRLLYAAHRLLYAALYNLVNTPVTSVDSIQIYLEEASKLLKCIEKDKTCANYTGIITTDNFLNEEYNEDELAMFGANLDPMSTRGRNE